jgi:hydrogenase expression/formation protein HypD
MHAILGSPHNRVQGFLAAGHVCTVMGFWEYGPISHKYKVPIVVTGFEPVDILQGILSTVKMLESNCFEVKNAYSRVMYFLISLYKSPFFYNLIC